MFFWCILQQEGWVPKAQSERTRLQRIAELVANKRNEKYADVMSHLRTRLRFSLLKSILVAVRGARGKRPHYLEEDHLANVSFNLILYVKTYEVY